MARRAPAPGEPVTIDVVLRRSGWIGWLAGSTDSTRLSLRTPIAQPSERYLTLPPGSPLKLEFDEPVRTLVYRDGEHLQRRELAQPVRTITLSENGGGGLDRSRRGLAALGDASVPVAGDVVPRRRARERCGPSRRSAPRHQDLADQPTRGGEAISGASRPLAACAAPPSGASPSACSMVPSTP